MFVASGVRFYYFLQIKMIFYQERAKFCAPHKIQDNPNNIFEDFNVLDLKIHFQNFLNLIFKSNV